MVFDFESFSSRHIGPDAEETAAMLKAVGAPSLDALIDEAIPARIRLKKRLELPEARLRSVKVPMLAVYGGESPAFMGSGAKAVAKAVRDGRVRCLDGQTHDIVPSALAPVLLEFFGDS